MIIMCTMTIWRGHFILRQAMLWHYLSEFITSDFRKTSLKQRICLIDQAISSYWLLNKDHNWHGISRQQNILILYTCLKLGFGLGNKNSCFFVFLFFIIFLVWSILVVWNRGLGLVMKIAGMFFRYYFSSLKSVFGHGDK